MAETVYVKSEDIHEPQEKKPKFDHSDPLRSKRKKARRACLACQRAHLTCGNERPCQRCIKRGLADTCQDGVRKKARDGHPLYPLFDNTLIPDASTGMSGFFSQVDTPSGYVPLFPHIARDQISSSTSQQPPPPPTFTTSTKGQTPNFIDPTIDPTLLNFGFQFNISNSYKAIQQLQHQMGDLKDGPPTYYEEDMELLNQFIVSPKYETEYICELKREIAELEKDRDYWKSLALVLSPVNLEHNRTG